MLYKVMAAIVEFNKALVASVGEPVSLSLLSAFNSMVGKIMAAVIEGE